MANTSLSSLRSEVRFRVVPDTSAASLDSFIDTRINWTIENLAHIMRIPELETTADYTLVSGTQTLALPSDWLSSILLKNMTESEPIEYIADRTANKLDEDEEGRPSYYYRIGRTLYLYPTPGTDEDGTELRLVYIKSPARLTSDSSLSPYPTQYDEAIICGASFRFLRDQGEVERAQRAYIEWVGLIRSLTSARSIEAAHSGQTISIVLPPSMV